MPNGCPVSHLVWQAQEPHCSITKSVRIYVKICGPSDISRYDWTIIDCNETTQSNKQTNTWCLKGEMHITCLRTHNLHNCKTMLVRNLKKMKSQSKFQYDNMHILNNYLTCIDTYNPNMLSFHLCIIKLKDFILKAKGIRKHSLQY